MKARKKKDIASPMKLHTKRALEEFWLQLVRKPCIEKCFVMFKSHIYMSICKFKMVSFSIVIGNIKAMELVLVDPGTVVGPNYSSKPICIECLHPGKFTLISASMNTFSSYPGIDVENLKLR